MNKIAAALLLLSLPAAAAELRVDLEADPTAYALGGYSLHAGIARERVRIDLGAFAMNVPRFVHGNSNFDQSFDGYGVKLQYFFFAEHEQAGLFAGVDGGLVRVRLRRVGTDLVARSDQLGLGVHAGYRIAFGRFYATPWLGVGYQFNASDVTLGGATFKGQPWSIFPAVHLGYRFN